jgi:putative heme transporter
VTQVLERAQEQAEQQVSPAPASKPRRRWVRLAGVAAVVALVTTELIVGWSPLTSALHQLRTPHVGWLALAVLAELAAMSAYARMQRRLLRSADVRASYRDHLQLAYAAHSLNETLPGGPAFSIPFNYQQMRRFGASPAIASWAIALSGVLSSSALAAITVGSALAAGGATHWQKLVLLLVAAGLLILGVRHVARHPETVESLIRSPLALLNRVRRRPAAEGRERIAAFLGQLRAAKLHLGHGLAAGVFALLNWLLDAACFWLCFRAVGEPAAAPTTALLAFCAAMAVGTVTVVPGGLGIIDSALILGLIAGGVTVPAAVATVVLYRIISLGFIITLGWVFWLRIRTHREPAPAAPARTRPRTNLHRFATCPRAMAAASVSTFYALPPELAAPDRPARPN